LGRGAKLSVGAARGAGRREAAALLRCGMEFAEAIGSPACSTRSWIQCPFSPLLCLWVGFSAVSQVRKLF